MPASVPRADQAHLLHAGHQRDDGLGQLDLALGGRAEAEAVGGGLLHAPPAPPGGRGRRIIGPQEPM
jgi:hypothetical protein